MAIQELHKLDIVHRGICMEAISVQIKKNSSENTAKFKLSSLDWAFILKPNQSVLQLIEPNGMTNFAPEVLSGA